MHTIYAIDIVRQQSVRVDSSAARTARHLAALKDKCRRLSGLRGLLGRCVAA